MKDYKTYFKGKRITIAGLGILGRGVNVAKFLLTHGAVLTITDLKEEDELADSMAELEEFSDRITYHLGGHEMEDFENVDMVIKAPGTPLDSPYIAHAREHGVPVKMDASLFVELMPEGVIVIGVTGTKGKSTVSYLIHHILTSAGKESYLGGNVRGQATLPLLEKVESDDFVVLELDSWQLQGFGDIEWSPQISVLTNFMPDHLNYYGGDIRAYFADKANIFKFQQKDDVLVVSGQAFEQLGEFWEGSIPGRVIVAKQVNRIKQWKIPLEGEHNVRNVLLAVQVAEVVGVPWDDIEDAVESFAAVPGRLEKIRELKGVKYYNDNNATTPEAVIAGLEAFSQGKIVLIAGGVDKQLDYKRLSEVINARVKEVILFPGGASEKIKSNLAISATEVSSMKEAVEEAYKKASAGDVVLFSPGAASFGLFKNEYDRNDQFVEAVRNL